MSHYIFSLSLSFRNKSLLGFDLLFHQYVTPIILTFLISMHRLKNEESEKYMKILFNVKCEINIISKRK